MRTNRFRILAFAATILTGSVSHGAGTTAVQFVNQCGRQVTLSHLEERPVRPLPAHAGEVHAAINGGEPGLQVGRDGRSPRGDLRLAAGETATLTMAFAPAGDIVTDHFKFKVEPEGSDYFVIIYTAASLRDDAGAEPELLGKLEQHCYSVATPGGGTLWSHRPDAEPGAPGPRLEGRGDACLVFRDFP